MTMPVGSGIVIASRTDDRNLSRRQSWLEGENFGHQRQSFIKLGAAGHQHHHRDLKFVVFCGKLKLRSAVKKTSNSACASTSSLPFLMPPQPIF